MAAASRTFSIMSAPPSEGPTHTVLVRLLQQAVETMQVGVTLSNLDGRVLYANPAEARLHRFTVPELLGQDVGIYSSDGRRRKMSIEDLRRIRTWTREGWNRRRDGSVFPVRLLSDVVRDVNGEPMGMVTTCEDITERRRAEDALRETASSYRALVEHSGHGICRIGPHGRFTLVNPALVRMLEYGGAEELLAADLPEYVYGSPEQDGLLRERARVDGRIDPFELSWRRRDGTPILVRVSGRMIETRGGRVEGFELFVEDVSERRILEDQLRQAQKMETVGQLTGGIAHDFNNLLTVVQANIEYIMGAAGGNWEEIRNAAAEVRGAAQRGSAMVRRLLAFSRHEGLQPQTVDLGRLCADYRDVLGRVLPETIEVQVSAEDGTPAARLDPRAFEQILLNLATNARDAMPSGGVLRLQVTRAWIDDQFRATHGWGAPGQYVAATVSDTGSGMSPEVRRHVFQPFFTTKPPGVGTGLGLSMVYGLMKQHRGFVYVYSEAGQGTAVKLWFPVADAPLGVAADAGDEAAPVGGTETILLVEDEAPIRRAARRALEQHGYRVLLAEDGEQALSLFLAHPDAVDLILTDLVMPRMGGRELFDRVRATGNAVPFLFASGYTRTDAEAAERLGGDAPFIQKPWSMGDLLRRVREALEGAPRT
jgi:two-component system, cell cycle sensor histidine kinase and response regulator CckA